MDEALYLRKEVCALVEYCTVVVFHGGWWKASKCTQLSCSRGSLLGSGSFVYSIPFSIWNLYIYDVNVSEVS